MNQQQIESKFQLGEFYGIRINPHAPNSTDSIRGINSEISKRRSIFYLDLKDSTVTIIYWWLREEANFNFPSVRDVTTYKLARSQNPTTIKVTESV